MRKMSVSLHVCSGQDMQNGWLLQASTSARASSFLPRIASSRILRAMNSSLSGSLGSLRDEAQLATEAINRVETQVTDVRTLTVQQEYFNALASGLFGLHYSSGVEEDGSTIRYAHTSERLEDSAWAWKSGIRGFFVSNDGGQTWRLGWDTADKVVKTAVEAVGVNANILGSGTLRTALVKILGTDKFYWENDAISRACASEILRGPATFFTALVCAAPPTRDTERPTFTAGLWPEKNNSGDR